MPKGTKHKTSKTERSVAVVLSVISLIVSVLSAVFAGLSWMETREHDRASLSPSVYFDTEDDPKEKLVGLGIVNDGAGPAVVKTVTYYVDRRPVRGVDEALAFGKLNADLLDTIELERDDSLGVGATVWLISRPNRDKRELDRFIEFLDQHVAVQIEYCSLDGQCASKCSSMGAC